MREGSKRLRRLGFAAVVVLRASATAALRPDEPGLRRARRPWRWLDDRSPESVGLDGARLCGIAARLKETEANVHAVVIARHGKLVFEQYFPGYDEPWGQGGGQYDFDATTKHDMRSASKSVISLLVGIAIDRKLIAGADEPVVKVLSGIFGSEIAGLGQHHAAPSADHVVGHAVGREPRLEGPKERRTASGQRSRSDPLCPVEADRSTAGHGVELQWRRNGPARQHLERVSGKSLEAFAREALFGPLGITDWEWMKYRNEKIASAVGLRLRPRDAAKIGQLVLEQGRLERPADRLGGMDRAIGHAALSGDRLFRRAVLLRPAMVDGRTLSGGKDVKWIAAMGLGGQRIFIVPDRDLVVMTTSGLYGSGRQGHAALDILANFVIPVCPGHALISFKKKSRKAA